MKAMRFHAYGNPEPKQLEDAAVPPCGPNDVLVPVVAAGVNPIDWKIRAGMARMPPLAFPLTLGLDAAGVVVAVGLCER